MPHCFRTRILFLMFDRRLAWCWFHVNVSRNGLWSPVVISLTMRACSPEVPCHVPKAPRRCSTSGKTVVPATELSSSSWRMPVTLKSADADKCANMLKKLCAGWVIITTWAMPGPASVCKQSQKMLSIPLSRAFRSSSFLQPISSQSFSDTDPSVLGCLRIF